MRVTDVFSSVYQDQLPSLSCKGRGATLPSYSSLQNLYQHRQTEPTDQESAVAPGGAAASLGGTTTPSTTAGADPGRTTATRCPCSSFAADLGNRKKAPQRAAASGRDSHKILGRPSLPARRGTGPTTGSTTCSGLIAGRD
jgi:hypothetical protein